MNTATSIAKLRNAFFREQPAPKRAAKAYTRFGYNRDPGTKVWCVIGVTSEGLHEVVRYFSTLDACRAFISGVAYAEQMPIPTKHFAALDLPKEHHATQTAIPGPASSR